MDDEKGQVIEGEYTVVGDSERDDFSNVSGAPVENMSYKGQPLAEILRAIMSNPQQSQQFDAVASQMGMAPAQFRNLHGMFGAGGAAGGSFLLNKALGEYVGEEIASVLGAAVGAYLGIKLAKKFTQ